MSWDTKPKKISVKAGKRTSFCQCGFSKDLPFCDNSHREADTDLKSLKITFEEDKEILACCCGKSKEYPICDKSHRDLK